MTAGEDVAFAWALLRCNTPRVSPSAPTSGCGSRSDCAARATGGWSATSTTRSLNRFRPVRPRPVLRRPISATVESAEEVRRDRYLRADRLLLGSTTPDDRAQKGVFDVSRDEARVGELLHRGRGTADHPGRAAAAATSPTRSRSRTTRSAGKPRELAADTAPPFRFSRVGPQGTPPERHHHPEAGPRDGRRWGRRRDDPRRLHLPRPVRRPRPHHGPDPGRARPGRVAHDDAAGPLAAARPRLALRQRPRQPRVREVLRGRRHAPARRVRRSRPRA